MVVCTRCLMKVIAQRISAWQTWLTIIYCSLFLRKFVISQNLLKHL
nr:MAG TPA: hypothetical protein [Caudoviricetes sp.]